MDPIRLYKGDCSIDRDRSRVRGIEFLPPRGNGSKASSSRSRQSRLPAPREAASRLTVWTSFACDYVARQKVGGINMTFGYLYQFACAPPEAVDIAFIAPRLLELTYTAYDPAPFARD